MEHLEFRMINATSELVAFCDQARENSYLVIDTEFVRTKTYLADLGLVQLKSGRELALVDPLEFNNLAPLWQLLTEQDMQTVLHAGGEDLEIISTLGSGIPANLFDTQIAWQFLHDGEQIGYAGLVKSFVGVELDKSLSRTDWLKRPLSDAELQYAAADVHYLDKIWRTLYQQSEDSGLMEYILRECAFQARRRARQTPSELAWRDIGPVNMMNGQQRACLRELARFRMDTARANNIALPFIARDHILAQMAIDQPTSRNQLRKIDDLHPQSLRRYGDDFIAAIERGLAISESEYPPALPRLDNRGSYKRKFREVKAVLKDSAETLGISPPVLGSRKQINELFIWYWHTDEETRQKLPTPDLLSDWRGDLMKEKLEAIVCE